MDVIVSVTEYKRHMKVKGYADKTIELYSWGLEKFTEYLKDHSIDDLRKVNLQTLIDYQADIRTRDLAEETRGVMIRAVKRLFEYLINGNKLLINPTEGIIETNRQHRKMGTVLTIEEMKRLLERPNLSLPLDIRDRAIMEVLYSTGIRSNELMNLYVYDADLKDRILFIRKGKGRKQRIVPMGTMAVTYLKEYLEKIRPRYARKNPKERRLFLSMTGQPITWIMIRTRVDEYRKEAGLKKPVGLHVFRRSCATHMLQKGADIRYVQKLLGHKYLKTTQRYTKVKPIDVKKTHSATHPNKEVNLENQ
jgi:integrase/recombinase XerD